MLFFEPCFLALCSIASTIAFILLRILLQWPLLFFTTFGCGWSAFRITIITSCDKTGFFSRHPRDATPPYVIALSLATKMANHHTSAQCNDSVGAPLDDY
jgi:hypothetical protein